MDIGGGAAFHLMIAVFAGYVAFSIADRPGLAVGLIGGMLATTAGAGILGGIVAGFLAGYVVQFLNSHYQITTKVLPHFKPILNSAIIRCRHRGSIDDLCHQTPPVKAFDGRISSIG